MKSYRRSLPERMTNLTLCLLFAAVALVVGLFSGPFWSVFGQGALTVAVLLAGFFAVHWVSSAETVQWIDTDSGPQIVHKAWWRKKIVDTRALMSVKVVPCDMRTVLRTEADRLVLSHKLIQFEVLLGKLRQERPDLFPVPENSLRLRTTHVGILSLILFAFGTALAGLLLGTYQPWMATAFYLAATVPLLRIVFFFPLEYRIVPGKLVIHYLARRRTLETRHLLKQRQDVYAAGGAVFFLLRLEFPRRTVVLDEGHLQDPLRPLSDWLSVALI